MKMISYAQNYEDVILMRALASVDKGRYIDVGAQHPINDSVTKAFYEKGWRGINIEPVDQWFKLLQRDRPEDTNLHAVVSSTAGEHVLYEVVDTGLSTGSATFAERHKAGGHEVVRHTVPGRTLDDVIESGGLADIHFLKIDVEGAEGDVLRSISLDRHRPWILVIEATEPNSQVPAYGEWEPLVLTAGYSLVYEDGLNRFYLAEEHGELRDAFRLPPNYFDSFMPYSEWWTRDQLGVRERELGEARGLADLVAANERAGRAEAMVTCLQMEMMRAEKEALELRNRVSILEEEASARPEQLRTMGRQLAEARGKLSEMDTLEVTLVELEGERQSLQWALRESQTRLEKLHTRVVSGRTLRLQLERQVHVLRDEVEEAIRTSAHRESECDALRAQLRQTDSERQDLLRQVHTLRDEIEQEIRASAHRESERDALRMQLSQADSEKEDLLRQVQRLVETVAESGVEKRYLETALASARDEVLIERSAKRETEQHLTAARDQAALLAHEQVQLQQGLRMREQQVEELLIQLGQVLDSRSWRLTAPLRGVRRMPNVVWRSLRGLVRNAGGGLLRVIAHVPGTRAIARRLLARHPALKEKLLSVIFARSVEREETGPATGDAPVSGQPTQVLSRSTREALTLIKAYRKQGR
jgi:FkbM family methyltransferase